MNESGRLVYMRTMWISGQCKNCDSPARRLFSKSSSFSRLNLLPSIRDLDLHHGHILSLPSPPLISHLPLFRILISKNYAKTQINYIEDTLENFQRRKEILQHDDFNKLKRKTSRTLRSYTELFCK